MALLRLDDGTLFRLRALSRRLWVRVAAFTAAGIGLAALSAWVGAYIPVPAQIDLAAGSVDSLLHILASSMLAVTTFSVSIMTGAYGAATSNATPRATQLLAGDRTAQTALAIFIGSFNFSIVGIIGIAAGAYPGQARTILFFATLGVIGLIAWALIRWVNHLNDFGRVSDIIARIEAAATEAAIADGRRPALGARPAPVPGLAAGSPVLAASQTGYLRHIDAGRLDREAEAADLQIELLRPVGAFVHRGTALARIGGTVAPGLGSRLLDAFDIGPARSFDQDPGFGVTVLAEVASRALSPAVNDPGTAIDAIHAATRVLLAWHEAAAAGAGNQPEDDGCGRVFACPLSPQQLYQDAFDPVIRDGAAVIEVQEVIQQALHALAAQGGGAVAQQMAAAAAARARAAMTDTGDLHRLAHAAAGPV